MYLITHPAPGYLPRVNSNGYGYTQNIPEIMVSQKKPCGKNLPLALTLILKNLT